MSRTFRSAMLLVSLAFAVSACGQHSTAPTGAGAVSTSPVVSDRPAPTQAKPGTVDSSFGTSGTVKTAGYGKVIGVTAQGRIMLASVPASGGSPAPVVIRALNARGQLDRSFGSQGEVRLPAAEAAYLYADGRYLLVRRAAAGEGSASIEFTRVRADGKVDAAFGDAGTARVTVASSDPRLGPVVAEANGGVSFAVGGTIVRLTASGQRDASFGQDGEVRLVFPADASNSPDATSGEPFTSVSKLARRPDGSYAVYAVHNPYGQTRESEYEYRDYLVLLSPAGEETDREGPTLTGRYVQAIGLDVWSDGSVVTSSAAFIGSATLRAVNAAGTERYRVTPGGFPSFVRALAGGKALLVQIGSTGEGNGLMRRFLADGALDAVFGSEGSVSVPFAVLDVFVTPDGRLLVSGDGVLMQYHN